jgi:chromosome segregation ATPase
MSETEGMLEGRDVSGKLLILVGVTLLLALGALVWCYGLSNHLSVAEQKLAASEQKNTELLGRVQRLQATSETLGKTVGLTQQQLEAKTTALMASQTAVAKQTKAETTKLAAEQAVAEEKIGAVATDVSTVKTDVGGAKASIAETQTDLAQAKAQMQRMLGDEGHMSGLIATNHDELEILKHKGDRNYFEFTLHKGDKPVLLSTVKLQLKKVDDKRSKYTMVVSSDDRNIEKKDKGLDEPVQFYSGKDHLLFELVVNSMAKNVISGYLSTPKNAPQALSAPSN